jgi:DNA methylase
MNSCWSSKGTAPHINNIELGLFGRNRTNVWDYPGQNIFNGTAKSKLSLHPTAKPIALVADAIRDCSHCSGIVLDPFGGVGASLIAAEKTGRKARLIELDPRYVDASNAGRRSPEPVPSKPTWPIGTRRSIAGSATMRQQRTMRMHQREREAPHD